MTVVLKVATAGKLKEANIGTLIDVLDISISVSSYQKIDLNHHLHAICIGNLHEIKSCSMLAIR